ncbi:MAG TPA: pantothenate kinase [Saprospirales bacterium]|nr:pantothenate kinase [Saprospirales bacterium]
MILALDIGNTRWKMGLFDGNTLAFQQVVTSWTTEQLVAFGNQHNVQSVIYAAVIELPDHFQEILEQHFTTLELKHATPLPFVNRYTTPHTLGKDRLAAVAGAQALYTHKNCLVIDCGTCIKYDLITAPGVYMGGNISPGLNMRSKAMHVFTARLPEVTQHWPGHFIGWNTESALQNGAFLGTVLEMNGFIKLFESEYHPLLVTITGGDAKNIFDRIEHSEKVHEPNLTLYGLNHILTHQLQAS